MSTVEITRKGDELQFTTQNTRFSMVELSPHGSGFEWLVLRETFFKYRIDGIVGGADSLIAELSDGNRVRWKLLEHGVGGGIEAEIVSELVYRVTKFGCCDGGPTFAYYSLIDGRKLKTGPDQLTHQQLEVLDESIYKAP